MRNLSKVVSGGQTGVDRAALDAALELGIVCGGWCPQGRWAEDGRIADRYPLMETPSSDPAERTFWNVRDSDGTLVLARRRIIGGTRWTVDVAAELQKPYLMVRLTTAVDVEAIQEWIANQGIGILNVAGPRESEEPGIYIESRAALIRVLELS
jgi:hypothetical protein